MPRERLMRLRDWLSFMPPLESVARSLVLDHLVSYNPINSAIWHLNKKDSLILLASYGDHHRYVGQIIPGTVWRNDSKDAPFNVTAALQEPVTWYEKNTQVVFSLFAQGLLIGFLVLGFAESVEDPTGFVTFAEEIASQISLYLALRFYETLGLHNEAATLNGVAAAGRKNAMPLLTKRQILILSGIAEKKTNHAIAIDLGYSVSTIRHETMRIFEAMEVSDRYEAVVRANDLGIT